MTTDLHLDETNEQGFPRTEDDMNMALMVALENGFDAGDVDVIDVVTFETAGLITRDTGLVLRMSDGTEFQLTVKRSR